MRNRLASPAGGAAGACVTQSNTELDANDNTSVTESANASSSAKLNNLKIEAKKLLSKKLNHVSSQPTNSSSLSSKGGKAAIACGAASPFKMVGTDCTVNPSSAPNNAAVIACPSSSPPPDTGVSSNAVASAHAAPVPHVDAKAPSASEIYLLHTGYGVSQEDFSKGTYPVTASLDFQRSKQKRRRKPLRTDPFSIIGSSDQDSADAAYAQDQEARQLGTKRLEADRLEELDKNQRAQMQADRDADRIVQEQQEFYEQQQLANAVASQGYY